VAVLLVLVGHLWPGLLPGGFVGVDVFFVISGYLITSHLLRHPPRRPRDLAAFWSRRVRRLLPAANVAILVTLAAGLVWLPSTMFRHLAQQAISSALYAQNWVLARQAVDYFAQGTATSPFQHFWSLSVEEQFYLVWPIVIGLLAWAAVTWRRRHRPAGPAASDALPGGSGDSGRAGGPWLAAGLTAVAAASFLFSLHETAVNPDAAYFITPTRMWELALGGLAALATPRILAGWARLPNAAPVRALTAWAGLGLIAVAAAVSSSGTPFPGSWALLPTVGAALFIVAESDDVPYGPHRLCRLRPVQLTGDISYSLYLWHFPFIVIAPAALGHQLTWYEAVAVAAVAYLVAWFSKCWIEDPFRRPGRIAWPVPLGWNRPRGADPTSRTNRRHRTGHASRVRHGRGQRHESLVRVFAAGAALMLVSSLAGGTAWGATARAEQAATAAARHALDGDTTCVGAAAAQNPNCAFNGATLLTSAGFAAQDMADVQDASANQCWNWQPFTSRKICSYGATADRTAWTGHRSDPAVAATPLQAAGSNQSAGPTATATVTPPKAGAGTRLRIALVGNSHAGVWQPALERLARAAGWTVDTYVASECYTALGVEENFDGQGATATCQDFVRWQVQTIASGGYDLVITSDRLGRAVRGQSMAGSFAPVEAGFARTLNTWTAAGIPVLVIRDQPYHSESVPDCVAAAGSADLAACGTPAAEALRPDPFYAAAQQDTSGLVHTFDPTRYFCSGQVCYGVVGGVVTHFDEGHMSATFSRTLAPYLRPHIAAALGGAVTRE
jgi:peptidoglycan/LPS O-acetylase OafA/YrhL